MSRKIKDAIAFIFIYLAAFYAVLLLAGIILYVFAKGVPVLGLPFFTTVTSVVTWAPLWQCAALSLPPN